MQLTGERIGQIRVSRILGRGGMGAVYEGFHEKLARRVALKVMHGEQHLGTDARARLVR
jgi:eukaryotic-like serine/threonine-protein kinase